jgi:hypothetical protein
MREPMVPSLRSYSEIVSRLTFQSGITGAEPVATTNELVKNMTQ